MGQQRPVLEKELLEKQARVQGMRHDPLEPDEVPQVPHCLDQAQAGGGGGNRLGGWRRRRFATPSSR